MRLPSSKLENSTVPFSVGNELLMIGGLGEDVDDTVGKVAVETELLDIEVEVFVNGTNVVAKDTTLSGCSFELGSFRSSPSKKLPN